MSTMPKVLSILMSLALAVSMCPSPAFAGDAGLKASGTALSAQAAVSMTQSEYNSKSNAFVNDGRWRNGVAFSNANGPKLSTYRSAGCFAYACDFTTYMYGINSIRSGSSFSNRNDIRQGDVIQVNGGGHTIVVLGRNGNSLYTAEGNYSGRVRVANGAYTVSGLNFYTGWHYVDVRADDPVPVRGSDMGGGYGRTIPDGDYAIVLTSTLGSDTFYYLDIAGVEAPAANGANVQLYSAKGKPADLPACDLWTVKYQDGFYSVTQKGTGAALDVNGASLDEGANVQAWGANTSSAQRWAVSANGDGYRLEAKCSGFSLDVDGAKTANGTNVQMWSDNDSAAQRWSFVPVGELCKGRDRAIPDGDYAIVLTSTLGSDTFYYADIAGVESPAANGANVQLYSAKGDPAKLPACDLWTVKYEDGFYSIKQKGTNAALDVNGASLNQGANVQAWGANTSSAQRWAISANGSGYRLEAKCSGYSLDAAGAKLENGTNIQMYSDNDSAAQRWSFVPVARAISNASIAPVPDQVYTGRAIAPKPVVTYDGAVLAEGTDYAVSYSNNTAAGTATVTVTGKGAYAGTKAVEFAISPLGLASASIAVADQQYTGREITPALTVKAGSATLKAGADYTISYKDNTAAGKATATVTGIGNYSGSREVSFAIAKANVKDATAAKVKAQKYKKGKAVKPSPKITYKGNTLKKGTDYTLQYKNNKKRGTATITVKGKGNFQGSKTVKFTIR